MNNHNFNESLINNLTIAEKIRYGFIPDSIANTIIEAKNAIDILDNYNLDLNDENCLDDLVKEIISDQKKIELPFLEHLLDIILDSEKEDKDTLSSIRKALENKINVLTKDL